MNFLHPCRKVEVYEHSSKFYVAASINYNDIFGISERRCFGIFGVFEWAFYSYFSFLCSL